MKTLDNTIRYAVYFAQSRRDDNMSKCDTCGKCFHSEEIHEDNLFDDGKIYLLCDEHYEIYLEENINITL